MAEGFVVEEAFDRPRTTVYPDFPSFSREVKQFGLGSNSTYNYTCRSVHHLCGTSLHVLHHGIIFIVACYYNSYINYNIIKIASTMARTGYAKGANGGHITTEKERKPKISRRKGVSFSSVRSHCHRR
jgi:hypothetical protein